MTLPRETGQDDGDDAGPEDGELRAQPPLQRGDGEGDEAEGGEIIEVIGHPAQEGKAHVAQARDRQEHEKEKSEAEQAMPGPAFLPEVPQPREEQGQQGQRGEVLEGGRSRNPAHINGRKRDGPNELPDVKAGRRPGTRQAGQETANLGGLPKVGRRL